MKGLLLLLAVVLISVAAQAQGNPAVRYLEVRQVQAGLQLTFTLASGNTCLGIGILRSDGTTPFSEIGFIGGVCGSTSEDITYTFVDTHPLVNRQGFYQLDLEILGLSGVVAARFLDYGADGVIAIPNVSTGGFTLYFSNPSGQPAAIIIYDTGGRKVHEIALASGASCPVDLSNERRGLYIFNIQLGGNDAYKGKLIVH